MLGQQRPSGVALHALRKAGLSAGPGLRPTLLRPKPDRRLRDPALHEALSSDSTTANGRSTNGHRSVDGDIKVTVLANSTRPVHTQQSNGSVSAAGTASVELPASSNGTATAALGERPAQTVADTLRKLDNVQVAVTALDLPARDEQLDACQAGQLEACAVDRAEQRQSARLQAAEQEQKAVTRASKAAGTPYKAPGGRWSRFRKYSTFQRTFEIWSFAIVFFFRLWLCSRNFTYGKQGMTAERVSQRKGSLAAWLREGLVKLGPTFIKIGQQFSTRVDVLSPEFVRELEKLQDNVPPFDSSEAVRIVERNLGAPLASKFDDFDREPIAAASLGQVHLARVSGERVVVKVQRPGLKDLFDIDLKNIRVLAQWLQRLDPKSDGAARDWVAIYDECSRILYQEIDYTLEGRNADQFRANFKDVPWIKVPRIMWELTSPEVLTMEYAPGVKINRLTDLERLGVDRKLLARRTVESYLQQLLTFGFFHADPHPGNIAVDDGCEGGRLVYYDFGMMGRIPSDVRSGLLELFYGVYQKDPDRCIDALVAMGVLVETGDRTAVRRTAIFFLNQFQERLSAQREEAASNPAYGESFKAALSAEEKKAKRKQILASIGEDLLVASADKPFRFPATFTFVVRSFTVLDGIGKGLDARFDISEIAAPYARELLLEAKPQLAKLQDNLRKRFGLQNRAVRNLFTGPNQLEDVANVVQQLQRGDLKLRVRALEAERALTRVQAQQQVVTTAVVASTLVNVGTVLSVSACTTAAVASFVGAGVAGMLLVASWLKVKLLERKEAQLSGAV